jgi:hypothetical protein
MKKKCMSLPLMYNLDLEYGTINQITICLRPDCKFGELISTTIPFHEFYGHSKHNG